jgi:hypothetical protein
VAGVAAQRQLDGVLHPVGVGVGRQGIAAHPDLVAVAEAVVVAVEAGGVEVVDQLEAVGEAVGVAVGGERVGAVGHLEGVGGSVVVAVGVGARVGGTGVGGRERRRVGRVGRIAAGRGFVVVAADAGEVADGVAAPSGSTSLVHEVAVVAAGAGVAVVGDGPGPHVGAAPRHLVRGPGVDRRVAEVAPVVGADRGVDVDLPQAPRVLAAGVVGGRVATRLGQRDGGPRDRLVAGEPGVDADLEDLLGGQRAHRRILRGVEASSQVRKGARKGTIVGRAA